MLGFAVEQITIDNIYELQKIGRQTFFETFSSTNTEENMQQYLTEGFAVEKLTKELQDSNSEFYFANYNQQNVGYLKVNFGQSQTEIKANSCMEIERIYVLKDFQGKAVGQLLFDKALAVARQKQLEYVWLGVWEENQKAINFYKRNGFVEFDKHIFRLGEDVQTDIMMKFILPK